MATQVDDEGYAYVVLICSGQFNDPDIECRLTDITRQLHMLATGDSTFYLLKYLLTSDNPSTAVQNNM